MRTVTPCYFSIIGGQVRPTFDTINLMNLIILLFSLLNFRLGRIKIMPEFTPNAYMLQKHADKG